MVMTSIKKLLIFVLIISMLLGNVASTADVSAVTVSTYQELKKALETTTGSNVTLGANIVVPSSLRSDTAIVITGGTHTLNLNGFSITYTYVNEARENSGVPITQQGNNTLTINGPGKITGGFVAIENNGDSLLVINGGDFVGQAASALRIMGVTVLNSGTYTGRFGDVWLEDGILVDNAHAVDKINNPFKSSNAVIEYGTLTGNAKLHTLLVVNDLKIAEGSSLTLERRGVLVVNGALTGEKGIRYNDGMLIKNGVIANTGYFNIASDMSLKSLEVPKDTTVMVMENYRLKIDGDLVVNGMLELRSGSHLIVDGNIYNNGMLHVETIENLKLKGSIFGEGNTGGGMGDTPGGPGGPDTGRMERAANDLYALGLFKGTGTDALGRPKFDLLVAPTRQVALTMLVRLLGKEAEALSKTWEHPFTDVDQWAEPYVGYAYTNGLTKGLSADRFGANDLVTTYQYLTFALRALGYNDSKGDFRWDDPTPLTREIELTSDDYADNSKAFYRGDIAIISHLALQRSIKNGPMLMKYLIDSGAVKLEDVKDIGMDHLIH
jgi:hypothetical protein